MKPIDFSRKGKNTLTKYLWSGFILSLVLTLMSYFLVTQKLMQGSGAVYALCTLASIQAFIQLTLFFHLGDEPSPRWNLATFVFMLIILVIVVAGSIWIMNNLDYNLMSDMGGA